MPKSAPYRPVSKRRAPLTQAMLLPIPVALANQYALKHHLWLAALRNRHGNREIVRELLTTIYFTFFLARDTPDVPERDTFRTAEAALKNCMGYALDHGVCWLDASAWTPVARILLHHDRQLLSMPRYRIDAARQRLLNAIANGSLQNLSLFSQ